jgi:ELWxxDGT repeat protein
MKYLYLKVILLFLLCTTTTVAQTVLKEIGPTSASSDPQYLTVVGTTLYFVAMSPDGSGGLWKSDGTGIGTVLIKGELSIHSSLTELNGNLYFQAYDDNSGAYKPWISDGTTDGTRMIKDVPLIDPYWGILINPEMTVFKGQIYFKASNGRDVAELWKTDGTADGTVMITSGSGLAPFDLSYLTVFNDELYFAANDVVHGMELWKTDGTSAGTVMVKDLRVDYLGSTAGSAPRQLKVFKDVLYFAANGGTGNLGIEIYKTDGTADGTSLLKDINPYNGDSQNNGTAYFEFNNELYFQAKNVINGTELWKTDGTEAGTVMVKDIYAGVNSSSPLLPMTYAVYNNKMYFQATNELGTELWITDGTEAGTVMIKDIFPGTGYSGSGQNSSNPHWLTTYNGLVYFAADNGIGEQLWRTDGTDIGTVKLTNYVSINYSPADLCVVNNYLYFDAFTFPTGSEVWKYYGAAPITTGILDQTSENDNVIIYPNPASEFVKVEFSDLSDIVSIVMYSPSGVLVNEWKVAQGSSLLNLDLQNLISGMYYIVLTDVSGKKITKKIIKK